MPTFGKEEILNLTKVIESGWFCDKRGGFMDQFRDDFAKALDVRHAITGATAMVLMQAIPGAIGARAGDEVICDPVVQFHGIACLHNHIVPVWADVRPDNFLMEPQSVEERITEKTKAIWVTHLWGYPAEVDKLREIADKHGVYLLEDCAHTVLAEYKGRKLGTWGHIGTFSFNMSKQLPTGEGGMAITNDDKLATELNKRIIFGESPEVLSSNYRMTEFQAAVGVEQLKKVPGYLKEYVEGRKLLDEVIAPCAWLDPRQELPGSVVAPYFWSCLFHGERNNISYGIFKAALRQVGARFGTGFLQRPAYMYDIFRNANAQGNCPIAEDIIPRIVHTNIMVSREVAGQSATALRKAIKLAESGDVEPLTYTEVDKRVLQLVKENGALEPIETARLFDEKGWEHFDEHGMWAIMENLRDRFPYKLSRMGPRKFTYHELS